MTNFDLYLDLLFRGGVVSHYPELSKDEKLFLNIFVRHIITFKNTYFCNPDTVEWSINKLEKQFCLTDLSNSEREISDKLSCKSKADFLVGIIKYLTTRNIPVLKYLKTVLRFTEDIFSEKDILKSIKSIHDVQLLSKWKYLPKQEFEPYIDDDFIPFPRKVSQNIISRERFKHNPWIKKDCKEGTCIHVRWE